ncbi:MAG: AmmeMemoRadiSam system protein B [Spirochaetota bacterium]|nr:AmmeMemoRadiSam system protein B [Spirochaetota bacterium]
MWHRRPVVAGSFYSSNPKALGDEIDEYLNLAEKKSIDGKVIGLISPHAGYVYSAPIAAYSYKHLMNSDIQIAIVLAPCHRGRFNGASVIPSGVYETPFGEVSIDNLIGEKLIKQTHFDFFKEAHNSEHSLEVQVPFLQRTLQNFTLVPIIIGTTDLDLCRAIAEEISDVLVNEKRKFIVVISTDLSHYKMYEEACRMDNIFIEDIRSLDEVSLYNTLHSGRAEACGQGPVLIGLILCKALGATKIDILKYANSGDTAGGKDQVVGYLSAAIIK